VSKHSPMLSLECLTNWESKGNHSKEYKEI